MTDRAVEFAEFLLAPEQKPLSPGELRQRTTERYGDLSREEFKRGVAIAHEILTAEAAENLAEADALDAVAAARAKREGSGR